MVPLVVYVIVVVVSIVVSVIVVDVVPSVFAGTPSHVADAVVAVPKSPFPTRHRVFWLCSLWVIRTDHRLEDSSMSSGFVVTMLFAKDKKHTVGNSDT